MSVLLVLNYLIVLPHQFECSTTILNIDTINSTTGNSQKINQSRIESSPQKIHDDTNQFPSIETKNVFNETKLDRVTLKSIKVYNKVDSKKMKVEKRPIINVDSTDWKCPNISQSKNLEHICSCDLPHTLRCSGDIHSLEVIVIHYVVLKLCANMIRFSFFYRAFLQAFDLLHIQFPCLIVRLKMCQF